MRSVHVPQDPLKLKIRFRINPPLLNQQLHLIIQKPQKQCRAAANPYEKSCINFRIDRIEPIQGFQLWAP